MTKFYRKAQEENLEKIKEGTKKDPDFYDNYMKAKKEYLLLNGEIQSMIREAEASRQPQQGVMVQQIREKEAEQKLKKKALANMEKDMLQPDFSLAFEYLRDVAMTIFPSGEHSGGGSDNSSFWNKNGMRLL